MKNNISKIFNNQSILNQNLTSKIFNNSQNLENQNLGIQNLGNQKSYLTPIIEKQKSFNEKKKSLVLCERNNQHYQYINP